MFHNFKSFVQRYKKKKENTAQVSSFLQFLSSSHNHRIPVAAQVPHGNSVQTETGNQAFVCLVYSSSRSGSF